MGLDPDNGLTYISQYYSSEFLATFLPRLIISVPSSNLETLQACDVGCGVVGQQSLFLLSDGMR